MQEEVFHEVADEFVHLANQLSDDWATPMLSAAIMYAAARYNAFHALETADGPEARAQAVRFLSEQYRKMLEENIGDLAPSA